MSFNGSGTFSINTSGQPVVTGTTISSSVFNALTADLATGLSTAICKDGQTATTARIPFASGISITGTASFNGATSGATALQASAVAASTTLTLPAATDTLVGRATTDTLTNKTLVAPILGTPASGTLTNCTGLPMTSGVTGVLPVANGGTNASSASIAAFNNITGYTAAGATGTTSTNLVFSTSPTITTPAITTSATISNNGIGAVATDGYVVQNTTAAAAGAQQYSPNFFHAIGQGWKTNATAASQQVEWRGYVVPVQGAANPTVSLNFDYQVNSGGWATPVQFQSSTSSPLVYISRSASSSAPELKVYDTNFGRGISFYTNGPYTSGAQQITADTQLFIQANTNSLIGLSGTSITFNPANTSSAQTRVAFADTAAYFGRNGSTTPVVQVSYGSGAVTGISITGSTAASGVALAAISSGTNEAVTFDAKGSGLVNIASISTGGVKLAAATNTASSGTNAQVQITPTYNQTSTAGATDLLINRTETAIGSGTQLIYDFQVGGTSKSSLDRTGNFMVGTNQATSTLGFVVKNAYDSSDIVVLGKNNGATGDWLAGYFGGAKKIGFGYDGSTYNTITSTNIPLKIIASDFVLNQNSIASITSINSGAVANTLYLSGGQVKFGNYTTAGVLVNDSSGNITSATTTSAPSTSVGVSIVNYYGSSATNFLGTPNAWLAVTIGGTAYKIPLYT